MIRYFIFYECKGYISLHIVGGCGLRNCRTSSLIKIGREPGPGIEDTDAYASGSNLGFRLIMELT